MSTTGRSNLNIAVPLREDAGGSPPDIPCFHCALPVTTAGEFRTRPEDGGREFCCAGCQAVSEVISAGGMERYYVLRDAPGNRPEAVDRQQFLVYDNPRLQQGWLIRKDQYAEAEFLVDGIACAACVWLIESWLARLPGVESADVNFSTHRLGVRWDPSLAGVSDLLMAVHQVGYRALPYTREARRSLEENRRRELLKRLGVAAALGMQVMVISVALYAGDWFGIEPALADFLRRVNLLLVLPIVGYSAQPFFRGAWRGIRTRSPGMDLPVSLGIALAFAGSLWATVSGGGDVYYDSIAMFVFFLLGARYLELGARLKGARAMDSLAAVVPGTARRRRADNTLETVPAAETAAGERLLVRAGEVVPADGVIDDGASSFDESLMTGEDRPVSRGVGDPVMAGSVNVSQPVTVTITARPGATVLDSILRLAERAHADKPRISRLAERVARWFVVGVVMLAAAVASLGLWLGNPAWLPTTIAVLVVTCPCALSLATPLALHAGIGNLVRRGVHVVRGHALETLNRVNHVVFDKTGTLTRAEMALEAITTHGHLDSGEALRIAAALEQGASHPLARPLLEAAGEAPLPRVTDFANVPGRGVRGRVDGKDYRLGTAEFVVEFMGGLDLGGAAADRTDAAGLLVTLGEASGPVATFRFRDELRAGAHGLVQRMRSDGMDISLLSGDRPGAVDAIARDVGIGDARGGCLPEQKLAALDTLIGDGRVVAMVGDGINDAPALARAHLGVAMARNVNLASASADMVITADDLGVLGDARRVARRTFRIIRQNIAWALTYNILAVPAALAGMVPPWLAGIGMSLSSVVVVLNAARLTRD